MPTEEEVFEKLEIDIEEMRLTNPEKAEQLAAIITAAKEQGQLPELWREDGGKLVSEELEIGQPAELYAMREEDAGESRVG